MNRILLVGFLIAIAMGCQGSGVGGGGEVKPGAAKRDPLQVNFPQLDPTGFKPVKLEAKGEGLEPISPMPRDGAARIAELKLPATSGLPFEVRDGEVAMKVKLLGQQPVAGVVKDDLVLFPGVFQGGDVTLRAVGGGIEDFIALDGKHPPFVDYEVDLVGVEGLRLVANTLEFLTADGNPRLRMAPPTLIAKTGRVPVTVAVNGCAFDTDGRAPWNRPVTAPGAQRCSVHLSWDLPAEGYPALLDPSWTVTGDLAVARFSHALVQLNVQSLLMTCGGNDTAAAPLASCELFNHISGTWAATNPMPRTHTDFAMAYSPASNPAPRVVAVGGSVASSGRNFVDVYDPLLGTWTPGPAFAGRDFLTATVLPNDQNLIVIVGGQLDGGGCTERSTNIFHYRINTNVMTLVGNLAFGRTHHQATALANGSILITGGLGTCCGQPCVGLISRAEVIPATGGNPVAMAGTMIRGRLLAATYLLPTGQVRIAGGLIDPATSQTWPDSELYTPGGGFTDLKTFPGSLQAGGWGAFGIMANGNLLVAGGGDNTSAIQTTGRSFVYDGTAWVADGVMNAPRRALPGARTPGGAVMAVGGATTTPLVVFRRTELFDLLPNGSPCAGPGLCQSQQCIDGVCCNTACGNNCDTCNATGSVGTCVPTPAASALVCRASSGAACDVADTCNGTSVTCPADGFASATTACRPSTGACDPVENCPGNSPTCPAEVISPATTVCRTSTGVCDPSENCTGTAAACPAEIFSPNTTVCRPVPAGALCDVAENCTGTSGPCPADAFTSGTECRARNGLCDVAELCNGLMASCPADGVAPAMTSCRGPAGTCDLQEVCSGTSTACGPDVLAPQGSICNTTYVCSGTDAGCPSTCTLASDCVTGAVCINGMCVIQVTPGNPCTDNNQCTTNFCVDGVCCNSACTEACATCNGAGSVGTCSAVAMGNPGDPSCTPYVCDGAARTCPGSCTSSTQCVAGFQCVAGSCVPVRPNGNACTVDTQCASGFCTDGVCCNSRCEGSCNACNTPGVMGTCTVAGRGEPGEPVCAPFVCDGTSGQCPTSCEDDAACGPPAFCENKVCTSRTRGHVGFGCAGCSAIDGASLFGLLGVVLLLRRRVQGGR